MNMIDGPGTQGRWYQHIYNGFLSSVYFFCSFPSFGPNVEVLKNIPRFRWVDKKWECKTEKNSNAHRTYEEVLEEVDEVVTYRVFV